jgi:hypothetical protein
MATYCPATGGHPDGICDCGAPAATEIQCGWHNGRDGSPSGGQYEEMCAACYAETEEAQGHAFEARVRAAGYVYDRAAGYVRVWRHTATGETITQEQARERFGAATSPEA